MDPRPRWQAIALVLLVVAAYVPASRCGYIFDDAVFLTANPLIHATGGLRDFWFSTRPPDYFPLTSTTLWLEWRLWGSDPAGYHLVNVALHAVSCVLLWRLLLRLDVPGAWMGAALFAVHPVNVQTVAWITQRKNTLPLVFALLSMLAYLRFEDSPSGRGRRAAYLASLLCFLLALLSKTSVVMLPLVLLACAWWRRGRWNARDLRRLLPFFVLALVLGLVTVWYQGHRAIGAEVVRDDSWASRLAIAGRAVWFYLGKALLPLDLSFVYSRWETGIRAWTDWLPLLALAVAMLVLWLARRTWGRAPLFAATVYVLALLPVLGFLDIYLMKFSLVADHYQYFALPAVTALAAAGWDRLTARAGRSGVRTVAAAALLLPLGVLTWQRQAAFVDEEALWTDTLAHDPGCSMAHNNLGVVRKDQGRLDEAVAHFEAAIRLRDRFAWAHYNLADTLVLLGRTEDAIAHYEEALRIDPDDPKVHLNLGNALQESGRLDEAVREFEVVLRLDPRSAPARYDLGNALVELGRDREAATQYGLALEAEPDHLYALNRYAGLLATSRDSAVRDATRAMELAQRAVALDTSGSSVPLDTLAAAYAAAGRFDEAARQEERALRVAAPSRQADYRRRLEAYRLGRSSDASSTLRR